MSLASSKSDSPRSPELHLATPVKLEEICKVDDFINVYKLQAVMNTLVKRIDSQQAHIEKQEHDIKYNNISRASFDEYRGVQEARLGIVEGTMSKWANAWKTIETAAEHMDSYHTRMNELITNQSQKVDIADFVQLKYDVSEAFDLHRQELDSTKASSASVDSLETSQRRILEEVVALQQLIACKVDRVEVPLLNVAGEKLKKLVDFSEHCGPRLAQLEDAIITTSKVIAGKIDKNSIDERIDQLQEQLRERPDFSWLMKKVLDPLDGVQRDLSLIVQSQDDVQTAIETMHALSKQFTQVQQIQQATVNSNNDLKSRIQELAADMRVKPSLQQVDERLVERDLLIEQILTKHSGQIAADNKLQSAVVGDMHSKLGDLNTTQQVQEKKIEIMMNFVNWFTKVKLEE